MRRYTDMHCFFQKILAFLLVLVFFFQSAPSYALESPHMASNDQSGHSYELGMVKIGYKNTFFYDYLLKDDVGNAYLSQRSIEAYTGYHFYEESWQLKKHDSAIAQSYHKVILIDYENKTAQLKNYQVDLPGLPVYMGMIWFPIAEIVPMLDILAYVEDGVLCFDQGRVSLMDAMDDLPIESLCFDAAKEFDGKDWADKVIVDGSNLYETFKGLKISNLTPYGTYDAYQDVFTEYMTDSDVFEKASAFDSPSLNKNILKYSKMLKKDYGLAMNSLKVIHSFAEDCDKLSGAKENTMLDVFNEMIPEDVFKGMKRFGSLMSDVVVVAEYALNANMIVQDNLEMLKAVYPEAVSKKPKYKRESETFDEGGWIEGLLNSSKYKSQVDTKHKAAKTVYEMYSDLGMKNRVYHSFTDLIVEKSVDALDKAIAMGLGGISVAAIPVAKLTGALMDAFLKDVNISSTKDLALLNHHIIAENDALEAYKFYINEIPEDYSWNTLNKARLSAIMTLISAKKCFEIIRDNNGGQTEIVNYCDKRIERIETYLIPLYLAAEGVLTDGTAYFEKEREHLKKALPGIVLEPEDPLISVYGQWCRENLSDERLEDDYIYLADVTGDCVLDMIVTHYGEEGLKEYVRYDDYLFNKGDSDFDASLEYGEGIFLNIYSVIDGEVKLIYFTRASFSHLGWTFWLLYPYEQSYAILDAFTAIYQGEGCYGYSVFRPVYDPESVVIPDVYNGSKDIEYEHAEWDAHELPSTDELTKFVDMLKDSRIIINTEHSDFPLGSTRYINWFLYQEINRDYTDDDNAMEETDEQGSYSGIDSAYQRLLDGLFITNIDNNTLWLTFEGPMDALQMNFGVTELNVDSSASVTLELTDKSYLFRIRDNGIISKTLPEFYQSDYSLIIDARDWNIYLDLGFDRLLVEDINN